MYNKMLMVKYTAEQTLTSNNPPEIAGEPFVSFVSAVVINIK